jgi:hypothetical protein
MPVLLLDRVREEMGGGSSGDSREYRDLYVFAVFEFCIEVVQGNFGYECHASV